MNLLRFSGAMALVMGALLLASCATVPFAKVPFDIKLDNPIDIGVTEGPSGLFAGDFNGDGNVDLVTFHFFRTGVSFLEGDGMGGFNDHGLLTLNPRPAMGQMLDYNNDGLPDLLVLLHDSREAVLLAGDETEGIRLEWTASLVHTSTAASAESAGIIDQVGIEHGGIGELGKISYLHAGDVDGDGELDFLVSYETGDVEVWHGDGTGVFEVGIAFSTEVQFPRAIVLDADEDGLGDALVFGNTLNFEDQLEGSQLDYYRNEGDDFGSPKTLTRNTIALAYQIIKHDFDNDGRQDAIVNYQTGGQLTVLRNLEGDEFETPKSFQVNDLEDVTFIDLDLDGDDEVVTVKNQGEFREGDVRVFLNAGDMRLRAPEDYTVRVGPRAVTGGDFNGDGLPDIAVANVFSDEVSVILNVTELTLP